MENTFTVKNFRIFDEEGATFKFKPITFLTGTNGSGKSSLTKALMLMHDFLTKGGQDGSAFDPIYQELDFTRPSLKLGGFDVEKNFNSRSNYITFRYTVEPRSANFLQFDVEYRFKAKEAARTFYNNGIWDKLTVRIGDEVFLEVSENEGFYNLDVLNITHRPLLTSFLSFYIEISRAKNNRQESKSKDSTEPNKDSKLNCNLEERKDNGSWGYWDTLATFALFPRFVSNYDKQEEFLLSQGEILEEDFLDDKKKYFHNGSFFYFEALKFLDDKSKEEVGETLRDILGDSFVGLDELILDFSNSKYTTLSDYYLKLEKETLSNLGSRIKNDAFENYSLLISRNFSKMTNTSDGRGELMKILSDALSFTYKTSKNKLCGRFLLLCKCLYLFELHKHNSVYFRDHREEIINSSTRVILDKLGKNKLYSAFSDYLLILIKDVIDPEWLQRILYLGDAHTNIQRVHLLSDKNDIVVSRLSDYFEVKKKCIPLDSQALNEDSKQFQDFLKEYSGEYETRVGSYVDKWLSELGIGESLKFDLDVERMMAPLKIVKDGSKNKTVFLADEGYGIYQIVLILISIETELLKLRLLSESKGMFEFNWIPPLTIILEEPEANLHPAFQSKLAEILEDAYKLSNGKIRFIIETHSEYLIRATQAIVAKTVNNEDDLKKIPFVVYYIEKGGEVYDMEYQVSGRFNKPFGTGFFDEAGKSSLEIIRKERRMRDGEND